MGKVRTQLENGGVLTSMVLMQPSMGYIQQQTIRALLGQLTAHRLAGHMHGVLCEGNVRIVVVGITGDLDFLAKDLGLPHFNSKAAGWMCPASREAGAPHCLTDLSRLASWKSALFAPGAGPAHRPPDR